MVNSKNLEKGDYVKALTSSNQGYQNGKVYKVIEVGFSRWDRDYYADIKGDFNNSIEINFNNKENFEKV